MNSATCGAASSRFSLSPSRGGMHLMFVCLFNLDSYYISMEGIFYRFFHMLMFFLMIFYVVFTENETVVGRRL